VVFREKIGQTERKMANHKQHQYKHLAVVAPVTLAVVIAVVSFTASLLGHMEEHPVCGKYSHLQSPKILLWKGFRETACPGVMCGKTGWL